MYAAMQYTRNPAASAQKIGKFAQILSKLGRSRSLAIQNLSTEAREPREPPVHLESFKRRDMSPDDVARK